MVKPFFLRNPSEKGGKPGDLSTRGKVGLEREREKAYE